MQSDGDLKSVQGNIGHATAAVLMDTYAHTQDKPLSELLANYNRIVDQTILLADKIEAYDSVMAFDHDVNTFWKLEAQA